MKKSGRDFERSNGVAKTFSQHSKGKGILLFSLRKDKKKDASSGCGGEDSLL